MSSEQLDAFIEASVASGRYGNVSEVVAAALQLLEREDDARKLEALRAAVQIGLQDLYEKRSRFVSSDELEGHIRALGTV